MFPTYQLAFGSVLGHCLLCAILFLVKTYTSTRWKSQKITVFTCKHILALVGKFGLKYARQSTKLLFKLNYAPAFTLQQSDYELINCCIVRNSRDNNSLCTILDTPYVTKVTLLNVKDTQVFS